MITDGSPITNSDPNAAPSNPVGLGGGTDEKKPEPATDYLVLCKRWFVFLVALFTAYLGFQHAFGGVWLALIPALEPLYHLNIDMTVLYYFGAAAALIVLERVVKFSFGKDGISADLEAVNQKLDENAAKLDEVKEDVGNVAETNKENQLAIVGGVGGKERAEPDLDIASPITGSNVRRDKNDSTLIKTSINPEDPRKGQFGGKSERDGRKLSANVFPAKGYPGNYVINLAVTAIDGYPPISGKVSFYLHDTFNKPIVTVNVKDGVARLERIAFGAFTVGAYVKDEKLPLELDLAEDKNFPEEFRKN